MFRVQYCRKSVDLLLEQSCRVYCCFLSRTSNTVGLLEGFILNFISIPASLLQLPGVYKVAATRAYELSSRNAIYIGVVETTINILKTSPSRLLLRRALCLPLLCSYRVSISSHSETVLVFLLGVGSSVYEALIFRCSSCSLLSAAMGEARVEGVTAERSHLVPECTIFPRLLSPTLSPPSLLHKHNLSSQL